MNCAMMKHEKKGIVTAGMFTLLKSPELIHPTIFPKIKENRTIAPVTNMNIFVTLIPTISLFLSFISYCIGLGKISFFKLCGKFVFNRSLKLTIAINNVTTKIIGKIMLIDLIILNIKIFIIILILTLYIIRLLYFHKTTLHHYRKQRSYCQLLYFFLLTDDKRYNI